MFWSRKPPETQTAKNPEAPESESWLSRLTGGLSKSAAQITQDISDLLTKSRLDPDNLEDLEDVLIAADLGPKTAAKIIAGFADHRFAEDAGATEIRAALAGEIETLLAPVAKPLEMHKPAEGPFVIVFCGVNGAGKTTTIGKLAQKLKQDGASVMLAAGDTFRAAAVQQLEEWARRSGAEFFAKGENADAAALAFEAYEKARANKTDVLLIDTAGRLHNKNNLMAELQKIIRVLKKHDPDAPHAVLLVLDATTGQNALEQARVFREMVAVTGLAVTKLDGSARGGILVALADGFGIPVHFIGVGEGIADLQPFAARDYARALLSLKD